MEAACSLQYTVQKPPAAGGRGIASLYFLPSTPRMHVAYPHPGT